MKLVVTGTPQEIAFYIKNLETAKPTEHTNYVITKPVPQTKRPRGRPRKIVAPQQETHPIKIYRRARKWTAKALKQDPDYLKVIDLIQNQRMTIKRAYLTVFGSAPGSAYKRVKRLMRLMHVKYDPVPNKGGGGRKLGSKNKPKTEPTSEQLVTITPDQEQPPESEVKYKKQGDRLIFIHSRVKILFKYQGMNYNKAFGIASEEWDRLGQIKKAYTETDSPTDTPSLVADPKMNERVLQLLKVAVAQQGMMTYGIEGSWIGIQTVDRWDRLCTSITNSERELCDYFGAKGRFIKEYYGKHWCIRFKKG
jgi:hypothetical protein